MCRDGILYRAYRSRWCRLAIGTGMHQLCGLDHARKSKRSVICRFGHAQTTDSVEATDSAQATDSAAMPVDCMTPPPRQISPS